MIEPDIPIEIWPDASDAELHAIVERIDAENRAGGFPSMTDALRTRVFTTLAFLARQMSDEDRQH